jgi:RND family efflux transporter MFP subunit
MNNNTHHHPNSMPSGPSSLPGPPDARKFTASVTDLPQRPKGPMDYPNQNNVMGGQQGQSILPVAQRPPSVPPYKPPLSTPQKQESVMPLVSFIVLIALLGGSIFVIWRFVVKPNTVANVTAYKVSAQTVADTVGGNGVVYPQNEMDVQYPEDVSVKSVNVSNGQTVKVGQSLMSLDVGQIASQVTLAQAKVQSLQALLNQDSVSNPTRLATDRQQLSLAQSELTQLQQQANSVQGGNLTSSINGVVTQINVNAGETVAANTPLLTIMDESNVVVHAKIPLANMGEIKVNQIATITASAVSNLTVNGKVTQVIPEADPQTDTFEVWVTVPNPTQQLMPGMSAFVNIQSTAPTLAVPRVAVLNQDSNPQVFVVGADNRAHLQSVHVSERSADFIYVDSGLTAGQEAVAGGQDTLVDNQRIHVTSVEP